MDDKDTMAYKLSDRWNGLGSASIIYLLHLGLNLYELNVRIKSVLCHAMPYPDIASIHAKSLRPPGYLAMHAMHNRRLRSPRLALANKIMLEYIYRMKRMKS